MPPCVRWFEQHVPGPYLVGGVIRSDDGEETEHQLARDQGPPPIVPFSS